MIFFLISQVKFCVHFSAPIYCVICTGGNYAHIREMCGSGSRFYRRSHSKGSITNAIQASICMWTNYAASGPF